MSRWHWAVAALVALVVLGWVYGPHQQPPARPVPAPVTTSPVTTSPAPLPVEVPATGSDPPPHLPDLDRPRACAHRWWC